MSGIKCNYWAGRGLMEVPRFCLAIAGKEYEDWRCTNGTGDLGNTLDSNLGRLPTINCAEGTVGQSAAINFYIASECGLMGSSTFEAAKIIEFSEHIKELNTAFRALVPWGSTPSEEKMAIFFDSEEATDYEGPADGSKRSARQLKWFLGRMEKLVGGDGFAVGEPFESAARTDAALDKCPKIKACIASVADHENVKKWLVTRASLPYNF
jgi:hypothetical protein